MERHLNDDFNIVECTLHENNWYYKGEGNANLIIAMKNDGTVIRIPKHATCQKNIKSSGEDIDKIKRLGKFKINRTNRLEVLLTDDEDKLIIGKTDQVKCQMDIEMTDYKLNEQKKSNDETNCRIGNDSDINSSHQISENKELGDTEDRQVGTVVKNMSGKIINDETLNNLNQQYAKSKETILYYEKVIVPLFSQHYFQTPRISFVNEKQIEILQKKLKNQRPISRQHKTIKPSFITVFRDLTLLPKYLNVESILYSNQHLPKVDNVDTIIEKLEPLANNIGLYRSAKKLFVKKRGDQNEKETLSKITEKRIGTESYCVNIQSEPHVKTIRKHIINQKVLNKINTQDGLIKKKVLKGSSPEGIFDKSSSKDDTVFKVSCSQTNVNLKPTFNERSRQNTINANKKESPHINNDLKPISKLSVYCIEIKPKQGWLAFPDRHFPKCTFCMHQYLKLSKKVTPNLSTYCPLDLFSGDESRMLEAIKALLRSPQNNVRIFQNGKCTWDETCKENIEDFLKVFEKSNLIQTQSENIKELDNFSYFIYKMLTRNMTNDESENDITEKLVTKSGRKLHSNFMLKFDNKSHFPNDFTDQQLLDSSSKSTSMAEEMLDGSKNSSMLIVEDESQDYKDSKKDNSLLVSDKIQQFKSKIEQETVAQSDKLNERNTNKHIELIKKNRISKNKIEKLNYFLQFVQKCNFNAQKLVYNCILDKILKIQKLDKYGSDYVYSYYELQKNKSSNTGAGSQEEGLDVRTKNACPLTKEKEPAHFQPNEKMFNDVGKGKVNVNEEPWRCNSFISSPNKLKINSDLNDYDYIKKLLFEFPRELSPVEAYLLSTMAKDCSILLAFQLIPRNTDSTFFKSDERMLHVGYNSSTNQVDNEQVFTSELKNLSEIIGTSSANKQSPVTDIEDSIDISVNNEYVQSSKVLSHCPKVEITPCISPKSEKEANLMELDGSSTFNKVEINTNTNRNQHKLLSDLSHCFPEKNVVEDLLGNRFVFEVNIADVNAKPLSCIEKHFKRDNAIVDACIEALELIYRN